MPPTAALHVQLIVYPGFKALEAIGSMSVFEYANLHLAAKGRAPGYRVALASLHAGAVPSDMAMQLHASVALGTPGTTLPDVAVIVGARHIEQVLAAQPALVDWVRQHGPKLSRLVALCSGSFFLAAAGLLDGQRATTHWSVAPLLRERFPRVQVDADAIYLRAGRVWTSAGVTAAIDLCLALVEEDFGRELALEVARDLVMYLKRPGGQSQFSTALAGQGTTHPGLRAALDWVLEHLHEPLPLAELAQRAAMSERNFRRVFLREVGCSPAAYIEAARLEAARRWLESSELPLKSVAARVGFASEQSLRKLFMRTLGVGPLEYRARFGGESSSA